jgi:hypothetical protein
MGFRVRVLLRSNEIRMSNESPPVKSAKSRPRGRSTASIIKAAKAAGCPSVKFLPDGTVTIVTTTHEPESITNGGISDVDVERWFRDHAS